MDECERMLIVWAYLARRVSKTSRNTGWLYIAIKHRLHVNRTVQQQQLSS